MLPKPGYDQDLPGELALYIRLCGSGARNLHLKASLGLKCGSPALAYIPLLGTTALEPWWDTENRLVDAVGEGEDGMN